MHISQVAKTEKSLRFSNEFYVSCTAFGGASLNNAWILLCLFLQILHFDHTLTYFPEILSFCTFHDGSSCASFIFQFFNAEFPIKNTRYGVLFLFKRLCAVYAFILYNSIHMIFHDRTSYKSKYSGTKAGKTEGDLLLHKRSLHT